MVPGRIVVKYGGGASRQEASAVCLYVPRARPTSLLGRLLCWSNEQKVAQIDRNGVVWARPGWEHVLLALDEEADKYRCPCWKGYTPPVRKRQTLRGRIPRTSRGNPGVANPVA